MRDRSGIRAGLLPEARRSTGVSSEVHPGVPSRAQGESRTARQEVCPSIEHDLPAVEAMSPWPQRSLMGPGGEFRCRESRMVEAEVVEGQSSALVAVASDPARIGSLYQILGEYCHRFRNQLNGLELRTH